MPAAVFTDIDTLFSGTQIRLTCIAAFLTMSQASEEHNKDKVFPVPVGDSKTPFVP